MCADWSAAIPLIILSAIRVTLSPATGDKTMAARLDRARTIELRALRTYACVPAGEIPFAKIERPIYIRYSESL